MVTHLETVGKKVRPSVVWTISLNYPMSSSCGHRGQRNPSSRGSTVGGSIPAHMSMHVHVHVHSCAYIIHVHTHVDYCVSGLVSCKIVDIALKLLK